MKETPSQEQGIKSRDEKKRELVEQVSDFWANTQADKKMYFNIVDGKKGIAGSLEIIRQVHDKIDQLVQELFPELNPADRKQIKDEVTPDLEEMTMEKLEQLRLSPK